MSFKSIKTKVRGMKRKIRLIENWKKQNLDLDVEFLLENQRDYKKLWISPFYDLHMISEFECGHINPPNWYNRLLLEAMIEVYKSWDKKLKELNQPYYLKIWLYDPRFIESQIVVAIGDFINFYDTTFTTDDSINIFPEDKYRLKNHNVSEFEWELNKDELVLFESEHLGDMRYLNYAKNKAYKIEQANVLGKMEALIYIRKGNVWVGSLKPGPNIT